MPTRSNVTCRLNAKFQRALERTRFDAGLQDTKLGHTIYVESGNTNCCGIEELDFQGLFKYWDEYKNSNVWNELVAKYIKFSCEVDDERVVFVGVPTRVGGGSIYDIDFYKKLRGTLNEFGFRELCKPYRNRNSGNTIVVLAGQMPE